VDEVRKHPCRIGDHNMPPTATPTVTPTVTPTAVRSTLGRLRGAAAGLFTPFAGSLPADRDHERLLADLRALPDAPADVESCLRGQRTRPGARAGREIGARFRRPVIRARNWELGRSSDRAQCEY
jgi:hypothetical protein